MERRNATPKQLAYIRRLRQEQGLECQETSRDLGFQEASTIIEELIQATRNNGSTKPVKVNEPRLGMAMKECFRIWKHSHWDIYQRHWEAFKEDVIRTYQLFTEVAQTLEHGQTLSGNGE